MSERAIHRRPIFFPRCCEETVSQRDVISPTICVTCGATLIVRDREWRRTPPILTPSGTEHEACEAEIARLKRERDEAVAHDRQPYPTAWAYEQVVKANEVNRERAHQAEERVAELENTIDVVWRPIERRAKRLSTGIEEILGGSMGLEASANPELVGLALRLRELLDPMAEQRVSVEIDGQLVEFRRVGDDPWEEVR